MSGGSWEYVMGIYPSSMGSTGFSSLPEPKYYDSYSKDASNYFGNAIYEVSTLLNEQSGWFTDRSSFVSSTYPCIMRGGCGTDGATTGIFAYYGYSGGQRIYETFRITITI